MLEQLPKAPPPTPRALTQTEEARLREHEEATLRELRLFLRDVLNKLGRDRKFQIFAKPVDQEEVWYQCWFYFHTVSIGMPNFLKKLSLWSLQIVVTLIDWLCISVVLFSTLVCKHVEMTVISIIYRFHNTYTLC